MGFMNYFTIAKPASKPIETEKPQAVDRYYGHPELISSRSSASPSSPSIALSEAHLANDIRHQVLLNHLYQQQRSLLWIQDLSGTAEGVMIRKGRSHYMYGPPELAFSVFAREMTALNVPAAMTVRSDVIEPYLSWSPYATDIPLLNGLRVQILPDMEDLHRARRHQYAAFIASNSLLVVWDDDPLHLIPRAKEIESELVRFVWDHSNSIQSGKNSATSSTSVLELDEEAGVTAATERPIMYYNSFLVACSVCLLTVLIGLGYQNIASEVLQIQRWTSLAFLVMTPVNFFLTLFFASVVISAIAQMIGPIQHLTKNSKFYSATPCPRLTGPSLPHITIQCPVYKESLTAVIMPTIKSIKQAISTYELQGGSANIFINDDGLQLISEEDRLARIDFYSDHSIGWTARPPHGKDGFMRKGKFKKASNMNYGLAISNRVEERLLQIDRAYDWTQADEAVAYQRCLTEVLEEDGDAWADGNIRIGDYIILIDSDTRVPTDCLLDAASEMEQHPRVAIIQFSSGVMQVAYNYFENGITFFTNMIYTAIRFGVASGDVAPFVGHNAILRWSAIQEVSFRDEEDGKEKFWSESSVSEDFDMALRLQVHGYIIRLAAWAGDGFKEGVSLTVYDELTRWEKYAYGCNELVFHPIRQWLWRGPFTPLFKQFLWSSMPIGSKLNIISYIGTYYAIGAAWIMTLTNYIVIGLYNGYVDKWYVESWKIWLSIIMVFSVAGNVALAVQRHRTSEKNFVSGIIENFMWCLMFIVFFGGMSLHVSQALLCHMFEINMSWGATAKEVEFSNFFIEVPKVAKKFKWSMCLSILMIVVMIVMAEGRFIPWSWNITQFVAIFPMAMLCACHLLLPIALNPGLMTFSW